MLLRSQSRLRFERMSSEPDSDARHGRYPANSGRSRLKFGLPESGHRADCVPSGRPAAGKTLLIQTCHDPKDYERIGVHSRARYSGVSGLDCSALYSRTWSMPDKRLSHLMVGS